MQPFQNDSGFWLFSAFVFAFGACIGSFLNVCIWRLPRGGSLVSPPSSCPSCGHLIRCFENIPIFSWIFLRGRCSACGGRISVRYAVVEALCGSLYLAIWLQLNFNGGHPAAALRLFAISALAITTFFIDIRHFIIPDATTCPVMVAGLLLAALLPEGFGFRKALPAIVFSGFGMLSSLLFMSIVSIAGRSVFKKDALGWGDVKYVGAVGACLGFPGAFFTLLCGSLCGSLYGLFLVSVRKKNLAAAIPFGPFLAVATVIWIFLAEEILRLYVTLSTFLRGMLD